MSITTTVAPHRASDRSALERSLPVQEQQNQRSQAGEIRSPVQVEGEHTWNETGKRVERLEKDPLLLRQKQTLHGHRSHSDEIIDKCEATRTCWCLFPSKHFVQGVNLIRREPWRSKNDEADKDRRCQAQSSLQMKGNNVWNETGSEFNVSRQIFRIDQNTAH